MIGLVDYEPVRFLVVQLVSKTEEQNSYRSAQFHAELFCIPRDHVCHRIDGILEVFVPDSACVVSPEVSSRQISGHHPAPYAMNHTDIHLEFKNSSAFPSMK
jgi:hypothetical protein